MLDGQVFFIGCLFILFIYVTWESSFCKAERYCLELHLQIWLQSLRESGIWLAVIVGSLAFWALETSASSPGKKPNGIQQRDVFFFLQCLQVTNDVKYKDPHTNDFLSLGRPSQLCGNGFLIYLPDSPFPFTSSYSNYCFIRPMQLVSIVLTPWNLWISH